LNLKEKNSSKQKELSKKSPPPTSTPEVDSIWFPADSLSTFLTQLDVSVQQI